MVFGSFLFHFMRLDVYLKLSRLISRRSLAQEFCDKGLVEVNGLAAKPSKEVKPGDEIAIKRRNRTTTVCVTTVPETKQTSKAAAAELYEIISDEIIESA